jgi:hypothetical protein
VRARAWAWTWAWTWAWATRAERATTPTREAAIHHLLLDARENGILVLGGQSGRDQDGGGSKGRGRSLTGTAVVTGWPQWPAMQVREGRSSTMKGGVLLRPHRQGDCGTRQSRLLYQYWSTVLYCTVQTTVQTTVQVDHPDIPVLHGAAAPAPAIPGATCA